MKKKVATIDTGSDSAMTNVLQPSRRNRKMIRSHKQAADHRVDLDVADRVADEPTGRRRSSFRSRPGYSSGDLPGVPIASAPWHGIGVASLCRSRLDASRPSRRMIASRSFQPLDHVGHVAQAHGHAAGGLLPTTCCGLSSPRRSPRPSRWSRRSPSSAAAALAAASLPAVRVVTSMSRISSTTSVNWFTVRTR